ncbi:MAG: hypothetical protein COW30_12735 [Rhodospirillales bacterium CG15_BIG_FIL_POST_REV_8_21_14_020_66_15]|nr:MAG: hypothetical protein COW30_12735 [Rhodospirillales bacterium CG15_BIG_FIL_POST_REV_8_21_14_020_66_15]
MVCRHCGAAFYRVPGAEDDADRDGARTPFMARRNNRAAARAPVDGDQPDLSSSASEADSGNGRRHGQATPAGHARGAKGIRAEDSDRPSSERRAAGVDIPIHIQAEPSPHRHIWLGVALSLAFGLVIGLMASHPLENADILALLDGRRDSAVPEAGAERHTLKVAPPPVPPATPQTASPAPVPSSAPPVRVQIAEGEAAAPSERERPQGGAPAEPGPSAKDTRRQTGTRDVEKDVAVGSDTGMPGPVLGIKGPGDPSRGRSAASDAPATDSQAENVVDEARPGSDEALQTARAEPPDAAPSPAPPETETATQESETATRDLPATDVATPAIDLVTTVQSALAALKAKEADGGDAPTERGVPGKKRQIIASGELVRDLQRRLKAKGFDPGKIDGKAGRETQEAIRAYQRSTGLEPDGQLSVPVLVGLGLMKPGANRIRFGSDINRLTDQPMDVGAADSVRSVLGNETD